MPQEVRQFNPYLCYLTLADIKPFVLQYFCLLYWTPFLLATATSYFLLATPISSWCPNLILFSDKHHYRKWLKMTSHRREAPLSSHWFRLRMCLCIPVLPHNELFSCLRFIQNILFLFNNNIENNPSTFTVTLIYLRATFLLHNLPTAFINSWEKHTLSWLTAT